MTARGAFRRIAGLALAAAVLGLAGCPGAEEEAPSPGAPAPDGAAGRSRHLDDARALFAHAEGRPIDEQTLVYEQLVRDYPDSELHEIALSRLALNYYVRGRLDDAEKTCHTFLNLYPASPHFVFPLQFVLDRAALAAKEAAPDAKAAADEKLAQILAEARALLERRVAGRAAKDDPVAWTYRVRIASLRGDSAEVIRIATELIDAFPSFAGEAHREFTQMGVPEALEARADAVAARGGEGDRERALADYEKLLAYLRSNAVVDKATQASIERVEGKIRSLR